MRNFTAGIERASRPRRKRMTVWSSPWRAMSTPMISGAVGSSTSGPGGDLRKRVLIAAGVIVLGVLFAELDSRSQRASETEFVAVGVN